MAASKKAEKICLPVSKAKASKQRRNHQKEEEKMKNESSIISEEMRK